MNEIEVVKGLLVEFEKYNGDPDNKVKVILKILLVVIKYERLFSNKRFINTVRDKIHEFIVKYVNRDYFMCSSLLPTESPMFSITNLIINVHNNYHDYDEVELLKRRDYRRI